MRIGRMTAAAPLLLIAACAVQPTTPAATPAAAPAAAPAAVASAAEATDAAYAEFVKYARSQGYRRVKTKDKELWCRDETPLGSRLEKQSCVTEATIADMQRQAVDARNVMRQGGSQGCPALGCN